LSENAFLFFRRIMGYMSRRSKCMKTLKQRTFGSRAFSPQAFAVIAAIIVVGFIFTGCNSDVKEKDVAVKSVTLDVTSVELAVGEEVTLTAAVLPSKATDKTVEWVSSAPDKVSVTPGAGGTATVKGLAVTTAPVTITASTKNGKTAVCEVTVKAVTSRVAVTGVTLSETEIDVVVELNRILTATIEPATATNKGLTWESSDTTKATVEPGVGGTAMVRGVAEGTATITVKTADGGHKAECEVTVKPINPDAIRVTGVTVSPKTLGLTVGGPTENLTATVAPPNATYPGVDWISSDPAVASVTNSGTYNLTGVVTAHKKGIATITAITDDGEHRDTCIVTVDYAAVASVELNHKTLNLVAGGTAGTLTVTVLPDTANQAVTWDIDNKEVATIAVDEDTGVATVTPHRQGTAIITVKSDADGTKEDTCTVTVNFAPVASVTLDQEKLDLLVGGGEDATATLTAAVLPGIANPAVTWESSDDDIATVDQTGVVTAVAAGPATITVKSAADGTKTAICEVTVYGAGTIPVTGITLNKTTLYLAASATETLIPEISPRFATNKTVTWARGDTQAANRLTVNATTGLLTAGTTRGTTAYTVRATTQDGGITATCTVYVVYPVTTVTVPATLVVAVGTTATLTPTVGPTTGNAATFRTVTWTSSNEDVATVSWTAATAAAPCTVTPKAVGTTTITVASVSNPDVKATCAVTVKPEGSVTGVTLSLNGQAVTSTNLYYIAVGGSKTLTATVTPANATNKNVTWASDDPTGVSVNNGVVTGLDERVDDDDYYIPVTITVTTADGNYTATCSFAVDFGTLYNMEPIQPGATIGGISFPSSFTMGSPTTEKGHFPFEDDEEDPDPDWTDETQHVVTLTQGFYMLNTPVMQTQYNARIGRNPSYFLSTLVVNGSQLGANQAYAPVEQVTWYDAVNYCNVLSTYEGFTPVYTITGAQSQSNSIISATVTADWSANGYRLPTEAEWEYACRAGTTTAYNIPIIVGGVITGYGSNTIALGSNLDKVNFVNENNQWYGRTFPAWYYEPNEWGLYAMHGNVEEFCWDWYGGDYGTTAVSNPRGAASGSYKVQRGGSYWDYGVDVRSASRHILQPGNNGQSITRTRYIGFRIVRNMPPASSPSGRAVIGPSETAKMQKRRLLLQQDIQLIPQSTRTFDKNSLSPVRPEALRRKAELE
jgi:uncharacterized protein YjdB/formylglycine-generating enzyme required for sulfatase activity